MDEDAPQNLGNENGKPSRHTWRGKLVLLLLASVVWMLLASIWYMAWFAVAMTSSSQLELLAVSALGGALMIAPFIVVPYIMFMV